MVLSPTRTYAPVVKPILNEIRKQIHGMVHCSGGGQTKVMKFVDKLHIIKDNLFPVPDVFKIIQGQSDSDWDEMYEVFNMGHRFEFYLPEKYADLIIRIAKEFNIDAQIIGHVEESNHKKLTIRGEFGEYEY
jgi:phosphoribosylformylglycinamidine cyclo-ligase